MLRIIIVSTAIFVLGMIGGNKKLRKSVGFSD